MEEKNKKVNEKLMLMIYTLEERQRGNYNILVAEFIRSLREIKEMLG